MTKIANSVILLATLLASSSAFAPPSPGLASRLCSDRLYLSEPDSAFVADAVEEKEGDDSTFEVVEKMGKGAAKVRLSKGEADMIKDNVLGG